MKLIKYRDAQMQDYTYFWVEYNDVQCSPNFDSLEEANEWANQLEDNWDNWKANKDIA